jgi:hypothetical protein
MIYLVDPIHDTLFLKLSDFRVLRGEGKYRIFPPTSKSYRF